MHSNLIYLINLASLLDVTNAGKEKVFRSRVSHFRLPQNKVIPITLLTHWSVVNGYHLYKDKISVLPADDAQITLVAMDLTAGDC